ncbi:fumarylacetoacetate hydrolase family protein [Alicyclobacillus fastidiosus]|uniref:Fumarylacetoacetate hydrolase family protein n=1 Tax=Alicyclobacillus fastidiosus TaxID=392011 RepID=A0ABV5AAL9_9BACL|nr:fumarylacetoacetate hydrolase family protein [Alicyclobacillus fastidiosus]WEH11916.1 fumarylacetoacetate hydrolase family protein [Alicyclobacillus fastidiosus]
MKFVTFQDRTGTALGLIQDHVIVNLSAVLQYLREHNLASEMIQDLPDLHSVPDLVDAGDTGLEFVQFVLKHEELLDSVPTCSLRDTTLLPPMLKPRKNIFCLGKNYVKHALEFEGTDDQTKAVPKHPIIFSKTPTTVIGPNEPINSHRDVTNALDYEAEIGVVMGKTGTSIQPENALDHIFGFVLMNDVTARDLQAVHSQWLRGKSLDTFCPMGPYVLHKSAVEDITQIEIGCRVNGEVRQHNVSGNMIFDIPTTVAVLSNGMTLEAGDIIATGTPEGVGIGFNPPKYLAPGDEVTIFSAQLGELINVVS